MDVDNFSIISFFFFIPPSHTLIYPSSSFLQATLSSIHLLHSSKPTLSLSLSHCLKTKVDAKLFKYKLESSTSSHPSNHATGKQLLRRHQHKSCREFTMSLSSTNRLCRTTKTTQQWCGWARYRGTGGLS
ncbi:hypothetical protein PanWU01x14_236540 [Parasponia andersonii]|uniref:Uncharacterized protein n=1 Tax=Parasponia andersonii TaxID=3476 RepID=A0A2P5BIE4_PARAD|nr:hypothetical protein PanWU01x14_236540 [Parasponia andersonii]